MVSTPASYLANGGFESWFADLLPLMMFGVVQVQRSKGIEKF